MLWATKRRIEYGGGVLFFLLLLIGVPTGLYLSSIKATCFDSIQNQGETATDRGGPCVLVDEGRMKPISILWARGIQTRPGSATAVAYIENTNQDIGSHDVSYRFRFYDDKNVLIMEREGRTFIMPGEITPIIEHAIPTGRKIVSRVFLDFIDPPVWKKMKSTTRNLSVSNISLVTPEKTPRLSGSVLNSGFGDLEDVRFVATIFDVGGTAAASSETVMTLIPRSGTRDVVFTWPEGFSSQTARIDIIPVRKPVPILPK